MYRPNNKTGEDVMSTPVSRCKKLVLSLLLTLGIGLSYAWVKFHTGWGIVCAFRVSTGLYCPGCGISTLCIALLRLKFHQAWDANPFLLAISPILAILAMVYAVDYVKYGSHTVGKGENLLYYFLLLLSVIWFILRNWVFHR